MYIYIYIYTYIYYVCTYEEQQRLRFQKKKERQMEELITKVAAWEAPQHTYNTVYIYIYIYIVTYLHYNGLLYYTIPYHTIPYHTIPYYTILYYMFFEGRARRALPAQGRRAAGHPPPGSGGSILRRTKSISLFKIK